MNTFLAQRPLRAFRFEIPLDDREMRRLGEQLATVLSGRGYLVGKETDSQGRVEIVTFQRVVEMAPRTVPFPPTRPAA